MRYVVQLPLPGLGARPLFVAQERDGTTRELEAPVNEPLAGAYTLTEFVPNDHIKLTKNPKFYDADNVKIDVVNYIPNEDRSAAMKRAGVALPVAGCYAVAGALARLAAIRRSVQIAARIALSVPLGRMAELDDLAGPLFTEYTFGSYLTFALPARLLWIDNRFNAYPPGHWETPPALAG